MRRSRAGSRVTKLSENRRVIRETLESEVVRNVVCKHSGLVRDVLVEDGLDLDRVIEDMVEARVRLDSEQVGRESVIREVSADGWVVDNDRDAEGAEQAGVTDTGKLENLGCADGASGEDDFLPS